MQRHFQTLVLSIGVLCVAPPEAFTQEVECGLAVGQASFYGSETATLTGGWASVWLGAHVEARVQVARASREDVFIEHGPGPDFPFPEGVVVHWSDRSRTLIVGHLLYHFSTGRVRPYAGVGVGRIRDRLNQSCRPLGCESAVPPWVLGNRGIGTFVEYPGEWALSVGVHGHIRGPFVIRGGLTLHNYYGEHLSTTELSVGMGLRF